MKIATSVGVLLLASTASAGELTHVTPISPLPFGYDATVTHPSVNLRHAIPPEPDSRIHPRTHEMWRGAVSTERKTGKLTPTNILHKPPVQYSTASSSTANWSGTVLSGIQTTPQGQAITATFQVPSANRAPGDCDGKWTNMAAWPGLDGFYGTGSSPLAGYSNLLQAGIEVDAFCGGGFDQRIYSAWLEWYPAYAVGVSQPAINPGDVIFVEVWTTSPTQGYVTIFNRSTNVSATYGVAAPTGISLKGTSAEWIVERPTIGGQMARLTNYGALSFLGGVTWDFASPSPTTYSMGADPGAPGTLSNVTMLDDHNSPISSATIENSGNLLFEDFGSACGGGFPPC